MMMEQLQKFKILHSLGAQLNPLLGKTAINLLVFAGMLLFACILRMPNDFVNRVIKTFL